MTKTGGMGGRWLELERPKPPRVDDHYAYWADPPPQQSERCAYWVRQIERGFRPNRSWAGEGYDTQCQLYGVWMWELFHVIRPALDAALIADRQDPV